jgi:hypothetical protein
VKRWIVFFLALSGCASLIGVSGDVSEVDAGALDAAPDQSVDQDAADEPDE